MYFVTIKIRSYCEDNGNSFLITKTIKKVNIKTVVIAKHKYKSRRIIDSRGLIIF